jgi:hypothetical protein
MSKTCRAAAALLLFLGTQAAAQTARPKPPAKPAPQKSRPQTVASAPICEKVTPSEIINGVYLQVARHPADPKTLADLGPRLAGGELSVKEIVRQLALSEEFKSNFAKARAPEQAIALVHERLLARPPNAAEAARLAESARANGFEFVVNSIIDGQEYGELFGERAVPGRPVRLRVCDQPSKLQQDDNVGDGRHMTTSVKFTADGRVESVTKLNSSEQPGGFCGRVAFWLFDGQGSVVDVIGPSREQVWCVRVGGNPDERSEEWKMGLPRDVFARVRAVAIIHTRDDASPRDFTRENVARARATKQQLLR